jgi:restriction system protein
MAVPPYFKLFNPLLAAIVKLGGSASILEQERTVADALSLSEKDTSEIHRGSMTKLGYNLAWARSYLKQYGLLDNSERGIWSLTPAGLKTPSVDEEEVKRTCRALARKDRKPGEDETDTAATKWEEELLEIIRKIDASAFERLCQRVLRELGFVQVEVTGRSGDAGIDGRGVIRMGGILSFRVLFQCKRYRGSVPPSAVRDLRGALDGRAEKGLILTTGTFSKEARNEAQRDGAIPIDLIDGEDLVAKLKDLKIGVEIKQRIVEEVVIQREYFSKI